MTAESRTEEARGQVSDAVKGNWVDRLAPSWSRPYLRLSRADRPIGTWLLLLPCWWGLLLGILTDGRPVMGDLWIFVGCGIGAFLMRGAGCTWNDITDRDIDGSVERTKSRPIPSGQVSLRVAVIWMLLQAFLASLILFTFHKVAIYLGILALLPVAIYPFAKRFTWWPQVFLGIAFNWGILLAFAAHTGTVTIATMIMYIAAIFWTLFYDTIYAHQDREDDALIGVKSTARLFGAKTVQWLWLFIALFGVLTIFSLVLSTQGTSLLAALLGVCAFEAHLIWQISRFDADDQSGLLRLFRSNRDAGLIVVVFLGCAAFL